MNLFKTFTFLILLVLPLTFLAKSSINVNFPGAKGKQVILWTYDDLISYREVVHSKTVIDSKNKFSLVVDFKAITQIRVQIDFLNIDLYIEPNKNYQIQIDSVNFSNRDLYPINIVGYLSPKFKIISPDKNEVNAELDLINQEFANFYDTNYVFLYQSRLPEVVLNNFLLKMDSIQKNLSSSFSKNHIEIQRAQLLLMVRKSSNQKIVDDFFTTSKISYQNKIYMDFFNSYWSKYILVSLKGLKFGELDSVVNLGSYFSLVRLLEKDPLLKNAQVREMVILRNIIQMYSDYRFRKEALSDILSDIANKGITSENRKIATNIRKQMLDFVDNMAPDFTLPDFQGESHSLSSFKGKYIYINFWNEQNNNCIAEMDITKDLFLDNDDIIQFISIYVGPETETAKEIISTRGYKWLQLYYNQDFELLRDYKVELFPYYILLNKEGQIEWLPAYLPSESFSSYFIKMLNDKKANLK